MPASCLKEAFENGMKKPMKLQLPVSTRWNTYCDMLHRLLSSKNELNAAIWNLKLNGLHKTDNLREILSRTNFWDLAKDLYDLSVPIARAISQIEGQKLRS